MTCPDDIPVDQSVPGAFRPADRLSDTRSAPCSLPQSAPRSGRPSVEPLHRTLLIPDALLTALLDHAEQRGTTVPAIIQAALLLGISAGDPGPGPSPLILPRDIVPVHHSDAQLRCALSALLSLGRSDVRLIPVREIEERDQAIARLSHRNGRLSQALEGLAFDLLPQSPTEVRQAAMMFGFASERCFDEDLVLRRFRRLAMIYHPDTGPLGSRQHMGQLVDARRVLLDHLRDMHRRQAP